MNKERKDSDTAMQLMYTLCCDVTLALPPILFRVNTLYTLRHSMVKMESWVPNVETTPNKVQCPEVTHSYLPGQNPSL